jgi:hypothetical protein
MPTLAQYLTETQRLLHDANNLYWSQSELTDYINDARNTLVGDTGCSRTLQTIYLSANLESYSYGSVTGFLVTAGGTGYTSVPTVTITDSTGTGATAVATLTSGVVTAIAITAGGSGYTAPTVSITGGGGTGATALASALNATTIDVLNVSVIWGTMRVMLNYMSFTEFNSRLRVWNALVSRPAAFSVYGQSRVYLGPIPDQAYASEWDTVVLPNVLVNATDSDNILYPYTSAVAYYAAHKAKLKEQSYNESKLFLDQYQGKVKFALHSTFTRRIPSAYSNQ